jgi:hypothetical protein
MRRPKIPRRSASAFSRTNACSSSLAASCSDSLVTSSPARFNRLVSTTGHRSVSSEKKDAADDLIARILNACIIASRRPQVSSGMYS